MASDWWTYVERVGNGAAQKDLAAASGIEQTAFSRWKQGRNHPRAEQVVQFARAYGRPPVEALVAAGYITDAEATAKTIEVHRGLDTMTDAQLLAEVRRRMHRPASSDASGAEVDASFDEAGDEGRQQA